MPRDRTRTIFIGALARATDRSPDTIRHYDRLGLLGPTERTSGGFRRYPLSVVNEVRAVQTSLALGFTLREIGEAFDLRRRGKPPCRRVLQMAEEKLAALDQEIAALQARRSALANTLERWNTQVDVADDGPRHLLRGPAAEPLPLKHATLRPRSALGRKVLSAVAIAGVMSCVPAHRNVPAEIAHAEQGSVEEPVRVWGSLRAVMHDGQVGPRVGLQNVVPGPHLYAVGALSEMRGEVTIVDDAVWLAYPSESAAIRVKRGDTGGEAATLLVAAKVPAWELYPLTSDASPEQLDDRIEAMASAAGLDVATRLPMLVTGGTFDLQWHVLNGSPASAPASASHGAAITGSLQQASGTLVGFFSKRDEGVFTHVGQRTHLHVLTSDNSIMGHVDHVGLRAGAMVGFPRPP